MSIDSAKLSAFLDGELNAADTLAVEQALEVDADLRAEMEALMAADAIALEHFEAQLNTPVPDALVSAIENFAPVEAANTSTPPRNMFGLVAACAVAAAMLGVTGGYWLGTSQPEVQQQARGWLDDIADYHRVYAAQKRHLVEVSADEADHIETWLTNTVGAEVRIPDLTQNGLTFQGARLLVAAGKPVAQLMYLDQNGAVVALCIIGSGSPKNDVTDRQIGDFKMVSWGEDSANHVVLGDAERTDLRDIATAAGADT